VHHEKFACLPKAPNIQYLEWYVTKKYNENSIANFHKIRKHIEVIKEEIGHDRIEILFMYGDRFWMEIIYFTMFQRYLISVIFMRLNFIYMVDHQQLLKKSKEYLKRILFDILIRMKKLRYVYYADSKIVETVGNYSQKVVIFSEPVFGDVKRHLGYKSKEKIDLNEVKILVCGSISARKGVDILLDAIIIDFPKKSYKVKLAGKVDDQVLETLNNFRECAQLKKINISIEIENNWLSDDDLLGEVYISNIVWLGYRDHLGPSGVLAMAQCYEKVVVGCSAGYIGSKLSNYSHGYIADLADRKSVQSALLAALQDDHIVKHVNTSEYKSDLFDVLASALKS
jgi:glycosyltransferase involved in cell wall biosynthesis